MNWWTSGQHRHSLVKFRPKSGKRGPNCSNLGRLSAVGATSEHLSGKLWISRSSPGLTSKTCGETSHRQLSGYVFSLAERASKAAGITTLAGGHVRHLLTPTVAMTSERSTRARAESVGCQCNPRHRRPCPKPWGSKMPPTPTAMRQVALGTGLGHLWCCRRETDRFPKRRNASCPCAHGGPHECAAP